MKKLTFTLLLLFAPLVQAQNYLELAGLRPGTHYLRFETDHFEFTFEEGYLDFTREAAKCFEQVHAVLSPILKWAPRGKTHILIADNSDDANGFTMSALRVGIVLIATPPDQSLSTSYSENWIKLLVFHEYTHHLNIDATTEWMEIFRFLFGDAIRPNGLWPSWMLEGLAVYFETRTSILGRGRSPYYDAIIRAYFNEGKLNSYGNRGINYGTLAGDWPYFPGGETPYAFGYQLWNQFSKVAKDDGKMGDYSINSSHRVPFFIDGNLENVIGKDWNALWHNFVDETSQRHSEQLKKIRNEGETSFEKITDAKYSAVGGAISPDGEWLAYTEVPLDNRSGLVLKNLKNGKSTRVIDKLRGSFLSFSPDSKILIFSSMNTVGSFQSFSDLQALDLSTFKHSFLSHGLRARDPHFSPDGKKVVFVVTDRATHVLKTADFQIDKGEPAIVNVQTAFAPKGFSIVGSPRWIDAENIIFSLQELNQAESKLMKVPANGGTPQVLLQNGKMNRFPTVCRDQILFVSDVTGVDNVYEWNGTAGKRITNTATSIQYPFCSQDKTLYGSVLTSDGFEIAKITSSSFTNRDEFKRDAPESIRDATVTAERDPPASAISGYSPWRSLAPRAWAPNLTSDTVSGTSLSGYLLGFDDTGTHQYIGSAGYHFKSATVDGGLSYTFYQFRPTVTLSAQAMTGDIGTFTSTQFTRTYGTSLSLGYPVNWTWSALLFSVTGFTNWSEQQDLTTHAKMPSADPEYSVPVVPGFNVGIQYSDVVRSKLGFMPEGGSQISATAENRNYKNTFSFWKGKLEYSKFFSLGPHHVLNPKLRYLGASHPYRFGTGNQYRTVLKGPTRSVIENDSTFTLSGMPLRGYLGLTARAAFQATLDFSYPIASIFGGDAPVFMKQIYGFIFGDLTHIPNTIVPNLFLPAFGLGFSTDTTLFWHFPLKATIQLQNGTRKDFGGETSIFFSLGTSLDSFF